MFNGIKKIISTILVATLCWNSIAAVFGTNAVFTSEASVTSSVFSAGTLELEISTTTTDFVSAVIGAEATTSIDIGVTDKGSVEPKYEISAQNIIGDGGACQDLEFSAWRNGKPAYNGSLALFNVTDLLFATSTAGNASTTDDWHFEAKFSTLSEANIDNGSFCRFDLAFNAWQNGIDYKINGFQYSKNIPFSIGFSKGVPTVKVVYPNGGEQWYIVDNACANYDWCRNWCVARGMNNKCEYEILWDAKSGGNHPNSALWIDLWYSTDSGQTWLAKIADWVPNSGKFYWKIPYDMRFISDKARIKAVATDKQDSSISNWDESDADFCPPLLSIEDLENRTAGGAETEPVFVETASSTAETIGTAGSDTLDMAENTAGGLEFVPMSIEEINREINIINNTPNPDTAEETAQPETTEPIETPASDLASVSTPESMPVTAPEILVPLTTDVPAVIPAPDNTPAPAPEPAPEGGGEQ